MGRRFTTASAEFIDFTGSTFLNGFDFRYGTMAICCWMQTNSGFQAYLATNYATGNCADWDTNAGVPALDDGTIGRTATTAVGTGKHVVVVMTKTTGSTTARMHTYTFNTRTWLHQNTNGASNDSAVNTSLTIGAVGTVAGNDNLDAEVWAVAAWPKIVMSDSEVERLARGNWGQLEPGFHVQFSDGREFGDVGTTLGRFNARESTKSGTTRGVQKPPPGFRLSPVARRR
jgi:hypothetical protein